MTAPSFEIDQPGGAGSGTAGQSRIDLWINTLCNLTCLNPPAGASFNWQILSAPSGSTATIINPTAQVAQFTPDVNTKSFRLKLTINAGGPGLTFIFIISCPKDNTGTVVNRGWRTPALNESNTDNNAGGNTQGYDPDYETIIFDLLANAFGAGGGGLAGVLYVTHASVSPQLSSSQNCASCDTDSGGALPSIAFPTSPTPGMLVAVFDSNDNASVNNVTLTSASPIQDPSSPGNDRTTLTFTSDNFAYLWTYDPDYGGYWNLLFVLDFKAITGRDTNDYTGVGTIAYIGPSQTQMNWTDSTWVDGLVGKASTNSVTWVDILSLDVVAYLGAATAGLGDWSVTVEGFDSGSSGPTTPWIRWDVTFRSFCDSAGAVALSPATPAAINSDSNGTVTGYNVQVILTGTTVKVQVQGGSGGHTVKWSAIPQVQWVT